MLLGKESLKDLFQALKAQNNGNFVWHSSVGKKEPNKPELNLKQSETIL